MPLAVLALLVTSAGAGAQPLGPGFFDPQLPVVLQDPSLPTITGPIDTRFFGTFCQASPREFCKSVPILPDPCKTLRDTRLTLDHLTTPRGGLLRGGGTFVLDGDRGEVVVAGAVLGELPFINIELSAARFAAVIPGLGDRQVVATLSRDGLQLTAHLEGRTLALRKDACGNNAPVVGLVAPFGPTFPFGQSVMLAGQITDEDTSFSEERLVFRSDLQGVLAGNRVAGGRTLFTTSLRPGPHRITFFVTDSGGLSGQASLDITVVNRPPETPRIFLPAEGATLSAGAPVLLSGHALDPDSGFLTGSALQWSAQLAPGGAFLPLGSGTEVGTGFTAPADPVRIRLTATDQSSGESSQAERQVRVVAGTGNAPPVVVIRQPDRLQVNGSEVAGFFSFHPASFVGTAFDVEDPVSDLKIIWEWVAISGPGGTPLSPPPVPNPAPIEGTLAPVVNFDPLSNSSYRVTLRATDRGGLSSSDSIEIFTLSSPIL